MVKEVIEVENETQNLEEQFEMVEEEIEDVRRDFEERLEELTKKLEDLEDAVSDVFAELEELRDSCKNVNAEGSEMKINATQELVLKLIERASFNNFNGTKVAEDLRRYSHLWNSVFMISETPLLALRDMPQNIYNADTLYIIPSGEDDEKLVQLAETWRPDSIDWLEGQEAGRLLGYYGRSVRILVLWWD